MIQVHELPLLKSTIQPLAAGPILPKPIIVSAIESIFMKFLVGTLLLSISSKSLGLSFDNLWKYLWWTSTIATLMAVKYKLGFSDSLSIEWNPASSADLLEEYWILPLKLTATLEKIKDIRLFLETLDLKFKSKCSGKPQLCHQTFFKVLIDESSFLLDNPPPVHIK